MFGKNIVGIHYCVIQLSAFCVQCLAKKCCEPWTLFRCLAYFVCRSMFGKNILGLQHCHVVQLSSFGKSVVCFQHYPIIQLFSFCVQFLAKVLSIFNNIPSFGFLHLVFTVQCLALSAFNVIASFGFLRLAFSHFTDIDLRYRVSQRQFYAAKAQPDFLSLSLSHSLSL